MGTLDGCLVVKQQLFLGLRQNMQLFCNTQFTFTRYCPTFHPLKDASLDGELLTSIF